MLKTQEITNLFNAITEGRSVCLRAVNDSARIRPMFKCAVINGRGEIKTGAEILDTKGFEKHPIQKRAEDIKKAAVAMLVLDKEAAEANEGDKTPAIQISHNMVLDLSNDQDAAMLLFSVLDGSVATTKSLVNRVQHFYYIEDKKAEAGVKLKSLSNKAKALELIKGINPMQIDAYVALLGLFTKPENITTAEKELALYELADTKPLEILNLFGDSSVEWKLTLQSFVNSGIVVFNSHKKEYLVQGNLIGTTFSEALSFIMDDKNQAVVNEWRKSLTGKKVSA